MELDYDARYTVDGYDGVAFYIYGYQQIWEPYTSIYEDEDGNEYEEESGEGEWHDNPDILLMVMVGDDRKFEVDPADITKIDDNDYCSECGQIGCTADGKMRDS